MRRTGTVRLVSAILGILFLLVNPAGVCAGTPAQDMSAHECCPKPADNGSESPCLCIDRAPDAPALPALDDLTRAAVVAPAPLLGEEISARVPEAVIEDAAASSPPSIILSIHQLLL